MAEVISACRRVNCNPQESGQCALGNDPLESCPEYQNEEVDLDFEEEEEEEEGDRERAVRPNPELRPSGLIPPDAIWPLLKSAPAMKVALVGEVKSGKTTLIAALYECFCKGPFAEYRFRSSRTLTAFARVHHSALVKSGRDTPAVPRTSQKDGVGYYHMNLTGQSSRSQHLLIADRSGEDYRKARSNTSLIRDLVELKLANRVCFLLDCARLTGSDTRHGYKRTFRQQIAALVDNNAFGPHVALEILATKLDRLAPGGQTLPDVSELDDYEMSLVDYFASSNITIQKHRICALPRSNYRVGLIGLEKLMRSWMNEPDRIDLEPGRTAEPVRQIDHIARYWRLESVG